MTNTTGDTYPFELNEKNEIQYLFTFMKDFENESETQNFGKRLMDFLKEDSFELGDLFD